MTGESEVALAPTDQQELIGWFDGLIGKPELSQLAWGIVAWAEERGLLHRIRGDEVAIAFPWLPPSEGWLTVAPLDAAVIIRFDKLKGFTPFDRKSRNRLLGRIDREGFVKSEGGVVFARVPLEDLKNELELKTLLWRLDVILELAENSKPAA